MNILLFLTDHFRRDAIGPWTPNLMALANRGVRFHNAYCPAPLCMPSRTSIVTGLLPSQSGVCGNMAEPIHPELRADTYPSHLQRAGYRTALIGKHHWIDSFGLGRDVTEDDEAVRGFGFDDVVQVVDEMEQVHNDDRLTHRLRQRGRLENYRHRVKHHAFQCEPFEMPEEDYADAFIADSALEWLDEQAPSDRPWYLNVSFVGPHPPFWHPGEPEIAPEAVKMPIIGAEDTPALRQGRSHYLQKCILIDRYIGRVLEKLEAMDQAEDTLIVFTSDHGDMLGDRGIWDKRHFYEQSVGVPLILAGPGVPKQQRMEGARQSRDLVSLLDLYPTFLAAAGLNPEGDRSHAPSLRGRRFGLDLRAMLNDDRGHRFAYAELGTYAMLADGAWKLVFDPEQGGIVQLFNRRNDPTEEHNLAGVAGYERISADLLSDLLSVRIGLSQQTQVKERMRLQGFRAEPSLR